MRLVGSIFAALVLASLAGCAAPTATVLPVRDASVHPEPRRISNATSWHDADRVGGTRIGYVQEM